MLGVFLPGHFYNLLLGSCFSNLAYLPGFKIAGFGRALELAVFHDDEWGRALRAQFAAGALPGGKITFGISGAAVEHPASPGRALHNFAFFAFRAGEVERDRRQVVCVFAFRKTTAGEKFSEAASLYDHGLAAFFADLVGVFVEFLLLDRFVFFSQVF